MTGSTSKTFIFLYISAISPGWALCTTQSHGTKLYILVSKLRSGTSKTMQLVPVHLDLSLFWKSHCATCSPVYIILYHVTGSCKGPIAGRYVHSTTTHTSLLKGHVISNNKTFKRIKQYMYIIILPLNFPHINLNGLQLHQTLSYIYTACFSLNRFWIHWSLV